MSGELPPSMARRTFAHPLLWPLLALALLLLGNGLFNPGFLSLEWRDGRLYGNLIDIANRAAPLILVSLGMTLVIAVRGLDISVGAVLAIAATVAAWTITRMTTGGGDGLAPLFAAIGAALAAAALCGLWNGLLVVKVGMQPIIATLILMVAGRGIAQLVSDGQILTIYYAPYVFIFVTSALYNMDPILEESGYMSGLSQRQVMMKITVPTTMFPAVTKCPKVSITVPGVSPDRRSRRS